MELDHVGSNPSSSIWKKARYGEDTIIGNLDTGEYFSLLMYVLRTSITILWNFLLGIEKIVKMFDNFYKKKKKKNS